jgi:N6-adenosine-specific RNA methylase IME4
MKKYHIIYADPPWQYRVWCKKGQGRTAESHYSTMTIREICALPVGNLAAADCALFLWATFPNLPAAFKVIKSWGFEFKTIAFVWVKRNKKSDGWFWGLGHWTRANAEICILATKGNPRRNSKSVHQIIDAPVQEHSKKPDQARQKIVELLGDLPRIELFAREQPSGWDVWGNEVESSLDFTAKGEDVCETETTASRSD